MALDQIPLIEFMEEARYSQTSGPLDNVFALHGMLVARGLKLPTPDYMRPVADVYREMAVLLMQAEGSLELIAQVGLPNQYPDMSSWVPDWSNNKHCHPIVAMRAHHSGADKQAKPIFHFSDDMRELHVQAVIVDHVDSRAELSLIHSHDGRGPQTNEWRLNEAAAGARYDAHLEKHTGDLNLALRLCNVAAARSLVAFLETQTFKGDKWHLLNHTLHGVCWNLSTLASGTDALQRWYAILSQEPPSAGPGDTIANESEYDESRWQALQDDPTSLVYHQNITQSAYYQTLFSTSHGSLGMAPYSIQKGDQVALISGMRVPAIVRPHGDKFRFVALAYVYDLMDGQKWPSDASSIKELVLV
jgi:hypothetical protein